MKERTKRGTRLRRTTVVLALGIAIGTMIMATPASAHFRSSIDHIWSHIKPKADARYERPVIQPGQTVRGTIGGQFSFANAGEVGFNAQLPRAAPFGLDDAHVTIDGTAEDTGQCTGTAASPTAAAGYVCMYTYSQSNMTPFAGFIWGGGDGTKWGFQASVDVDADGQAFWFANWAYKAPASAPVIARSSESSARDRGGS